MALLKKAASSYGSSNPNFYVGMKRLVPTGPNPEQSPESPPSRPLLKKATSLVPTGPNPEQSPESPPSRPQLKKATSFDGSSNPSYYVGLKRLVPTGPNPEQSPASPPSRPSLK
ncbi:hypothetical protein FNV43_RR04494 [Rhamnella rubrinervis]|uniref:Uncharacterized protein n=1 Tax=Rhamnella rubrinervis TaxID=2594499 RepID=A0A8K0HJV0_9ROSA|nr:hypothetical protein FNV43_RR04494 [Rhamnella rubrinervis]